MGSFTPIIILVLIGFLLLAFILLAPIYRFLSREEEEASKEWTEEALARRRRDQPPSPNGTGTEHPKT